MANKTERNVGKLQKLGRCYITFRKKGELPNYRTERNLGSERYCVPGTVVSSCTSTTDSMKYEGYLQLELYLQLVDYSKFPVAPPFLDS